ncbi:hypothetical protein EI42_03316 [Thermosporothrix hazakensis]|jgi:hypothetical protein|uniref:Uncharacterized protein n=2 Tax=Thermosporothrix TaxID=768650 RepID=A0A326U4G9_THEHA|nr:hypothetical protein [Thermosporothrix hazakensis]PZW27938.1 hypothetical protein EI42_03316 [Thermosporothrix hazakensis]BBH86866.1 hypothetical protein KTC_16170 [Thermosporothrix sp. COM3]GCE51162.1 hypothetical protein KTH_60310 [Thermosporothrix hazakensis]
MKQKRYPSWIVERTRYWQPTGRQRVHALLRSNPKLTLEDVRTLLGPRARGSVRTWYHTFFGTPAQ